MGTRLDNMKSTFANAKSRAIVSVVLVVLIIASSLGYLQLRHKMQSNAGGGASVQAAPQIAAIPGVGDPSRQYVKLQEQQNAQLSEEALKKGTAAVPTLIRTTYLDTGVAAGDKDACSVEELTKARNAGVTAAELRCRGCNLAALKAAGFTAAELRAAGFSAKELRDAGFTAADLRAAGFSAKELAGAGFSAQELKSAGFTAAELSKAGFSAQDLKAAGFSDAEIAAAGVGLTNPATRDGKCDIESLKEARDHGVSAAALKNSGCDAAALKAAGFTAAELRAAGFSAKDLKDAGFSAQELKNAGFSAADLKDAGFSAADLKAAGFSAAELRAAGFSAKDLKQAGFTPDELRAAGYTTGDLLRAGFSASDLGEKKESTNVCDVERLQKERAEGVSAKVLKERGCGAEALKAAGFSAQELKDTDNRLTLAESPDASGTAATPAASVVAPVQPQFATWQDQLDKMRKQQAQELSAQEYQDRTRQLQQTMNSQAGDLFAAWMPLPSQQYVPGVAATAAEGAAAAAGGETAAAGGSAAALAANGDILKAGTVLFAVLDTAINSDEQSPIMATIVEGRLKGAKVLGNFQRVNKRVVVQFNTLSAPYMPTSIPLSAVAIDPNTARTAMATSVDNHYMLRYGTLFAASFLGGVGQAVQSSGATERTTVLGEKERSWQKLDTTGKTLVGLGAAGQKFADVLSPLASTPPTVEVQSGSGVGILLMADLAIPKPPKKEL